MLTNLHLRFWNDSAFIRNRKEIAQTIRHQVKPRDLTDAQELRAALEEYKPAISLEPAFDQHREQDSDFHYRLMTTGADHAFPALLACLRMIHQYPYSYLPARQGKQVTKGDEALTLPPEDEAAYMKPAVILAALNDELRKLEEGSAAPRKAA